MRFGRETAESLPAHLKESAISGVVDGGIVEAGYRGILSVRREMLVLLESGEDPGGEGFRDLSSRLLAYSVVAGVSVREELKALSHLSKVHGWAKAPPEEREVEAVPKRVMRVLDAG